MYKIKDSTGKLIATFPDSALDVIKTRLEAGETLEYAGHPTFKVKYNGYSDYYLTIGSPLFEQEEEAINYGIEIGLILSEEK